MVILPPKPRHKTRFMESFKQCDGECCLPMPPGLHNEEDDGYVTVLRGGRKVRGSLRHIGHLNQLTKEDLEDFRKNGDHLNEWVKVSGVVDSGAITTVTPPNLIPWVKAVETPTSKNKSYFTCALGNKVYDEGLKIYEGFSDIGAPLTLPATAAKVGKTLLSVREMTGASNIVAFGMDEDHAIVNLKTGSVLSKGGQKYHRQ